MVEFTVRCLSDIHLELMKHDRTRHRFYAVVEKFTPCHLLILAGDIGNPKKTYVKDFLMLCRKIAETIIYVAGNHEYYKHTLESTEDHLRRVCTESGVYYLNQTAIFYKGYTILGCTLWSEIPATLSLGDAKSTLNDFRKIADLTVGKYNTKHQQARQWLEEELAKPGQKIVVTHHLPSYTLIPAAYQKPPYSVYNHFYASPLDDLVKKARYWFHGHSHWYTQTRIGDCLCYRNPLGYVGEHTKFQDELLTISQPE